MALEASRVVSEVETKVSGSWSRDFLAIKDLKRGQRGFFSP